MANPILLIISLIAGLVAGFIYLWNTSEKFRNFWINLWESIKNTVSTAINFIVEWFNKIINFVKNNWQNILSFIANPFIRTDLNSFIIIVKDLETLLIIF